MSNEIVLMENRQLVPRWHTSRKTIALQFPVIPEKNEVGSKLPNDPWLVEARLRWQAERSLVSAIELNASLHLHNLKYDKDYIETKSVILDNINKIPVGIADALKASIKFSDNDPYYTTDILKVRSIIGRLKSSLRNHPRDWLTWSDIAFYYALLGEDDRALHCLKISSDACPSNPFILRSHARFLVHIGKPEEAVFLLKKSGISRDNPLVASGALAISESFDLQNFKVSDCKRLLKKYSGDPVFSSDLLASLGTIEFRNGNLKKAKEFFSLSLKRPSENALAQYGWLHHKYGFNVRIENYPDVRNSIESQVNQLYVESDFEGCRAKLLELHRFQPFTDAALTDAGYMSLLGLDDPHFVIELSKSRSSYEVMSFGELNNFIVAHLILNQPSEIEGLLKLLSEKSNKNTTSDQRGVFLATAGMFMFKVGNVDEGRVLYEEAIEHFGNRKSMKASALAKFFYGENLKGIDDVAREKLMVSAADLAKRHAMRELVGKPSLAKYLK